MKKRRRVLTVSALLLGAVGVWSGALVACADAHQEAAASPAAAQEGKDMPWTAMPPLRDVYKGKFLIGATLSTAALQGRAPMDEGIATAHFDALTAENAMKPDAIQPREGEFRFAEADRLVEMAQKSGATAVGHTLVWHSQTPRWFFEVPDGKPASRELALARMRKHIATVV